MANNQINLTVNVDNLDEAIAKANQLKATLEECRQLINSLSSSEDIKVNLSLDGKSIYQAVLTTMNDNPGA